MIKKHIILLQLIVLHSDKKLITKLVVSIMITTQPIKQCDIRMYCEYYFIVTSTRCYLYIYGSRGLWSNIKSFTTVVT